MSNGNAESIRGSKWPALVLVSAIIFFVIVAIQITDLRYDGNDPREDTARQSMMVLEQACKSYTSKFNGVPPATLQELISPKDGGKPYVEGAEAALLDPWGHPYQYDPSHMRPDGTPDPIVFTINPSTKKPIYAPNRLR